MAPTRRVALITGAAGDIGQATAQALAADGWALALTDHPSAETALAASARDAWTATFDVTDDGATRRAIGECASALGVPTAVFVNAGVQGPFTRIDRYPLEAARRVLDVNVLGAYTTLAVAGAAMVDAGRTGSIVCSASMAGVGGAPNMSAYSASKAAVIGLVKSAAKDLAPAGIRVNAVSPAFIGPGAMWDNQVAMQAAADSPYYADEPATVATQMLGMIPLRRYGSPAEVAAVVAFLLSDAASYVTGTNVEIAGGSV